MRGKKERSKQGQTNKAKQHSTLKAVTFPKKNELPRVGLEPTTLYTPDRALYQYMYMVYSCFFCVTSTLDNLDVSMYMYMLTVLCLKLYTQIVHTMN